MEAVQLDQARKRGDPLVLLDVREPFELQLASVEGALHIPMRHVPERLSELDPRARIVVMCHHGVRSAAVCGFLRSQGFEDVHNLEGGIDAWSSEVDPSVPLY